jgi:hypothetical protein
MVRTCCIVRVMLASLLALSLAGCASKGSSTAKKLDGVYHQPGGGPATLTIKEGKAIMTIGTETQTLDYKVEGNKLTLLNPKEGDVVFTINDDGTLNSQLGSFTKSAT